MFGHRPAELFFEQARHDKSACLPGVPLASGLFTGKMFPESEFGADDHRQYNRTGAAFDVGETFSGLPFDVGLEAMEELRPLVPDGTTPAQLALAWILSHEAVSTVIPGGKNPDQVADNAAAVQIWSHFPPRPWSRLPRCTTPTPAPTSTTAGTRAFCVDSGHTRRIYARTACRTDRREPPEEAPGDGSVDSEQRQMPRRRRPERPAQEPRHQSADSDGAGDSSDAQGAPQPGCDGGGRCQKEQPVGAKER